METQEENLETNKERLIMSRLICTNSWSDNANSHRYYADNECIDCWVNNDGSDITEEQVQALLKRDYSMFPVLRATTELAEDKKTLKVYWTRSFLD